ncbi:hypothetical protein EJ08DRAFT_608525 [Tothia fuscella]|uniref:F-box domain-containing protein n=1 Tax=Tothia fuscella TaxID=1048955 RepID=A0A9P4NWS4_9PEZI|nr:hypothetical protein EJ08DRAFT_608525 [Tothia fuscella]
MTSGPIGICTEPPGASVVKPEDDVQTHMSTISTITPEARMPTTLLDLLSNSLVLRQTAPYLPVSSLLKLACTNKTFRDLVSCQAHESFRYLDLSMVTSANIGGEPIDSGGISWRSKRMDEALTEDEFYAGPLRGIMSRLARQNMLEHVSTMILDGLSVPADVVREIISEDRFNVRILSIREAKHLNERLLMQVLNYAVRPSRPAGTPKLKGLYVFGPMDPRPTPPEPTIGRRRSPTRYSDSPPSGVMTSLGAQIGAEWHKKSQDTYLCKAEDKWYQKTGRMFKRTPISGWAETLQACEGLIHFDAVLCRGPRHDSQHSSYIKPTVASVALGPDGCAKCGSCPEQPARFGSSPPHHLPLLSPPPIHASSIRAAQLPQLRDGSGPPPLFIRCEECLKQRWCERCSIWWDEDCYSHTPGTRTELQNMELLQDWQTVQAAEPGKDEIKVHMGLCVEKCLVGEMMSGAGSGGMW